MRRGRRCSALAIAEEVRAAHPRASHPYGDAEGLDTAKSVAVWVWSCYDGGILTRVRVDEAVRRENDRERAVAFRRARGALPVSFGSTRYGSAV